MAALLVTIIGVAFVGVLVWWYSQQDGGTPSPGMNTYSKYRFTFEYPQGMSLSEQGMLESTASNSSGIVTGESSNGGYEVLTVGWLTTVIEPDLATSLNAGFEGMETEGTTIDRGQLVTAEKAGDTMKYQDFNATIEGETYHGIFGVWYCDTNDRFYELIVMHSEQDALQLFEQYLDSFICH